MYTILSDVMNQKDESKMDELSMSFSVFIGNLNLIHIYMYLPPPLDLLLQYEMEHENKKQKIENICKDETDVAPYQKEFLEFSLQQGVLKFGSFVLKSGRTSPYFFNAGLFASGASLWKLGKAYAASIYHNREL